MGPKRGTTDGILVEFGAGGLHWKLPGDFNFSLDRSNITTTVYAIQIELHIFLKADWPDLTVAYSSLAYFDIVNI
jgi:hypothetical protein